MRKNKGSDPHPALRIIGLADKSTEPDPGYDVAREHDRFLAESEEASWQPPARDEQRRDHEEDSR